MLGRDDEDLGKIFKLERSTLGGQHILLEICIGKGSVHNLCLSLADIHWPLKDDAVSYTLHAVFYQELEGVTVLIHVKVASMHLGDYMANVAGCVEFWRLFQFKDHLLQMVVAWKDCNDNQGSRRLLGCLGLLFELQNLLNKFCS